MCWKIPKRGNDICPENLLMTGSQRQQVISCTILILLLTAFSGQQDLINWLNVRDSFMRKFVIIY